MKAHQVPNAWEWPDERFEGLLKIANAINTAFDLATGSTEAREESEFEPDLWPVWTPLRLAQNLREGAEGIEEMTRR